MIAKKNRLARNPSSALKPGEIREMRVRCRVLPAVKKYLRTLERAVYLKRRSAIAYGILDKGTLVPGTVRATAALARSDFAASRSTDWRSIRFIHGRRFQWVKLYIHFTAHV